MQAFKPALLALAIGQVLSMAAFADTLNASTDAVPSNADYHSLNTGDRKFKTEEVLVTRLRVESVKLTEKNSTGSRLGISALETPAAIVSLSGDTLRSRGDTDVVRAVSRAAGIAALPSTGSGGYGFSARGFGSSSVTLLYDGMKSLINTGSLSYPYDTWNVERLDVLTGPASVLYGGGAIGAAVNIVPRKPSAIAENILYVSAGSNSTYQTAIDSTGPLSEQLLYRIDISHTSGDGYVQRGETHSTSVTAALKYLVADNLSITLSADYGDRKGLEYLGAPLINGKQMESLRHINYSTYDGEVPFTDYRTQLGVEWQPSDVVSVRNATAYIRGERLWKYASRFVYRPATDDIQRSGYGTFLQHQDQFDNHTEVAWHNTVFGLDNALSAGLDLVRLTNDRYVDSYIGTDFVDLRNSNPGQFPTAIASRNYQDTNVDQYSVFAEDRLQLNEVLSAIAGIRFDHSEVERKDLFNHTAVDKTFTSTSWRVGFVYALADDLNIYVQRSSAIDPVANTCCISAAQMDFAMSEGKQTEIGFKQSVWDGRLEWTLAAYDITKKKLLTPDPNNLGVSIQVGEQSSRGVEVSMAVDFAEVWRIELNGTVLRARYEDFAEAISGTLVDREGNRPINTPERSANLWVTWAFAPRWNAQAGARYVGPIYGDTANTLRVEGYTVVDAGLHWDAADNIGIDVRGKNIFDKFYAYSTVSGTQLLQGPPRTAEAALTVRF